MFKSHRTRIGKIRLQFQIILHQRHPQVFECLLGEFVFDEDYQMESRAPLVFYLDFRPDVIEVL